MKRITIITFNICFLVFFAKAQQNPKLSNLEQVTTKNGVLQGKSAHCGIVSFKGIPYAQPPVGQLRWKAPLPMQRWKGVRLAQDFGPRAFQRNAYDDMIFRSAKESEDCLYLNVWTPAVKSVAKAPVLVYFYGGGFASGDGSEPRYDGESMARKGIVFVTVNYRLNVFGFMAHPELSKESPAGGSGNYGLLDQNAALQWIKDNIAAFGGNQNKITIAGESAGSMSVSAQMATPLSKGLFQGAIGQSGSILGLGIDNIKTLATAEKNGVDFMKACGAKDLAALRAMPAEFIEKVSKDYWFPITIDNVFFKENPLKTYTFGKQMDIPLLAGWTTAERSASSVLGNASPTQENFNAGVTKMFGPNAPKVLSIYKAKNDGEIKQLATDLSGDNFIAYATWKWIDIHGKTNGYPVYRYLFSRKRPEFIGKGSNNKDDLGAVHASDIEYALGNLHLNERYKWTKADFATAETFQNFIVNFVRSGNPNGAGLPKWSGMQSSIPKVMTIDSVSTSEPEKNLKRYIQLDALFNP